MALGDPGFRDGGSAEHASRGHVRADRGGARFVHLAPGGHGANSVGGLHVTPGEMLLNAGNVELHEAAAVLQELADQRAPSFSVFWPGLKSPILGPEPCW